MTYSYITIINMHTQALYWSCIELIMDIHLNHDRKVSIALWTITCTHSINYNYFNLSKVFIKIYNTDISVATVICTASGFVYYCQLFTHKSDMYWQFLSIHNYALFLDRITNWIFNRTGSQSHYTASVAPSHQFILSNLYHSICVMGL